MKTIILKIVRWLVKKYLPGYHISKNPKRKTPVMVVGTPEETIGQNINPDHMWVIPASMLKEAKDAD